MMLVCATLLCLAVLYAPGYLASRAFRLERFASFAIAPLFTILVLVALGLALYQVGFSCDAKILLACACGICALAWLVNWLFSRRASMRGGAPAASVLPAGIWKMAGAYVLVALVVTLIVFVAAIGWDPQAFPRNNDSIFHLSCARSFLDTGTCSLLHVSPCLDHHVSGGFYPAAWHVVTAIVASFFGADVALANNAVIIATSAFVFPLSMCLLFSLLFDDTKRVLAGAVFAVAFCGFPWAFLDWGQILPNLLSWALLPAVFALVVLAINAQDFASRARGIACILIGIFTMACAHPNGVFTLGIWAVAYGTSRIFFKPKEKKAQVSKRKILAAAALVCAAFGVWIALQFMPALQSTIHYDWPAKYGLGRSILNGLLFMFTKREAIQPVLSILVLIGMIYSCKNRRYLWFSAAFAFAFIIYVVNACSDTLFRDFLAGFWYNDTYRTGGMVALFAIPLATLGFTWVVQGSAALIARRSKKPPSGQKTGARIAQLVPALVLVALIAAGNFMPGTIKIGEKPNYLGLMNTYKQIRTHYSWQNGLTHEEYAFVEKVMKKLPGRPMIVNMPNDGSAWCYGLLDLNTFFRNTYPVGLGTEAESKIIRTQLCNIATSKKVQEIVRKYNLEYVLILDTLASSKRTLAGSHYTKETWKGVESITPKTPGFTLVMKQGDMRLYHIDAQ